jgi:hypothetical protein
MAVVYGALPAGELWQLQAALLRFFQDKQVKVSLLLQDGLQLQDGSFVLPRGGAGSSSSAPAAAAASCCIQYFDAAGKPKGQPTPLPALLAVQGKPSAPGVRASLGSNLYDKERAPAAGSAAALAAQAAAAGQLLQAQQKAPGAAGKGAQEEEEEEGEADGGVLSATEWWASSSSSGSSSAAAADGSSSPSAADRDSSSGGSSSSGSTRSVAGLCMLASLLGGGSSAASSALTLDLNAMDYGMGSSGSSTDSSSSSSRAEQPAAQAQAQAPLRREAPVQSIVHMEGSALAGRGGLALQQSMRSLELGSASKAPAASKQAGSGEAAAEDDLLSMLDAL